MAKRPKFDQAEFLRTLDRMKEGSDLGEGILAPAFDPKQALEITEAAIAGRKIEDYKPALENNGFTFYPANRLPLWSTGAPRREGEWRNTRLQLAFAEKEVLAWFRSPEDFANWVDAHRTSMRAASAGLALARGRRS